MANAAELPVGRSVGHEWALFMATSGQFSWPPVGRSSWPLTAQFGQSTVEVLGKRRESLG